MKLAELIYKEKQLNFLDKAFDKLPIEINIPLFSEWASDNRVIPPGVSEYYGPFDWNIAPHLKEPLDLCHPDSPYTHISLMKSVQSAGTTTVAENALAAFIRYKIGSVLFLTSSKGIGAIRGSANIDTLIDNSDLKDCLKPMSNRTGKKTKDNTFYKEFAGGIKLLISSYNSIGDLKSNTFHCIICDEWDEAGTELKDQGDIAGIIEGRTKGLRMYKIIQISTPTRAETSRINKSFNEGDQREYFLPCPECGERQILELKGRQMKYGLTFTTEEDKKSGEKVLIPETVRYICKYCGHEIYESKKQWMLQNGIWISQKAAINPKKASFHTSGLIAPEPFLSWERICQDFIGTRFGDDLLKFKDFTINDLGNPWLQVKKNAEWEMLRNRAEEYALGDIPEGNKITISGLELYDGPLILYAGCDVQKDRLELCVTGFGINGNKWIVDYQIFYGDTSSLDDPAWLALHEWVYTKEYKILNKKTYIYRCAIDVGYNPKQDKREKDYAGKANIVYNFVFARQDRFIAVMGNPDEKTQGILKESRVNDTLSQLKKRYFVSVSLLKQLIMDVIDQDEGYNAIHVPKYTNIQGKIIELPDDFYQQFLSERYQDDPKSPGNFKWVKITKRNEVLDTFIYSIAAAEFDNVIAFTNEAWYEFYITFID